MSARLPLSVVIPVRNEARYIESTLRQLIDQTLDRREYEILVVDGGSSDGTPEIVAAFVREYPDVQLRLLPNPARLSSAARNIAVGAACGSYFLLIDGHVYIPSRHLLSDALALARKHEARCLGRPQPLDPPDISTFQRAVALARSSLLAHSRESFIYSNHEGWVSPLSVGVMYRRDVIEAAGGFDERFDAAEDLEFNYRLEKMGVRCYISPKLMVQYYPRSSPGTLFRQMRRYGIGRARFLRKHPERFRIENIVPAAFVLGTAGLGLLAIAVTPLRAAWVGLVALYAALLLAEGARLYVRTRATYAWLLPAIVPIVHAGLGVGFLEGLSRSRASAAERTLGEGYGHR